MDNFEINDDGCTKNIVVIYHKTDMDGLGSCAIIKKYLSKYPMIIPYFIGFDYNDNIDFQLLSFYGKDGLIIADFSFKPEIMLELIKKYNNTLYWFDHHSTAINDSIKYNYSNINGIRKNEIAACELVWEGFFSDEKIPRSIKYISNHDTWNHEDPNTLLYYYGLMKYETDPLINEELWVDILSDKNTDQILNDGKFIQEYEKQKNKNICKSSAVGFVEFEGYRALVVNRSHINSLFFESIPEFKYDIILIFYYLPLEKIWKFSIYTENPDINVGFIAKAYGGGGHKSAAGFYIKDNNILNNIIGNPIKFNN